MSKLGVALLALLLAAVPAFAGCGEDDEAGAVAQTATASPSPAAKDAVPAELDGVWAVTLKRSELESPPDDLKAKTSDWELSFRETGGDNDGPSLKLANAEFAYINPITVAGDVITNEIPHECVAYTYAVAGDELTFKAAQDCTPNSLESVLTTRPWRRTQ